ncbi:DUF447 domain-containing protein [Hyphomicrobium sp. 99]|uniref:DUF447 domain-containing protein n=1 Tax=Hyphomicrobium sp. 99 TaxID=1163419 RepID=UPI0005F86A9A|nr:DUF447 domain-containing protein [Hyphomicrobium sp. 99]
MPRIVETIVTTFNSAGEAHIAPLGLINDGAHWIIAPFRPSTTLENLRANPVAAASHTDDVRVFAGAVTGRKIWPLAPTRSIKGERLADCVSHWELTVDKIVEDEQRPRFYCSIVDEVMHKAWQGFNRAQAAVIELAVLTTRLNMLPPEKVESELKYLEIAISKTAGPREEEAWEWLMEKISAWRQARFDQTTS